MLNPNAFRDFQHFTVRFLALVLVALAAIRLLLYVGIWVQDGFALAVEQIRSDGFGMLSLLVWVLALSSLVYLGSKKAISFVSHSGVETTRRLHSPPVETTRR